MNKTYFEMKEMIVSSDLISEINSFYLLSKNFWLLHDDNIFNDHKHKSLSMI